MTGEGEGKEGTFAQSIGNACYAGYQSPASRARAYCDCNPIRAYETFDISKELISRTSRFWMFWYKRGSNWLGAIKGMALWSRGFSRGSLLDMTETGNRAWKASGTQGKQIVTFSRLYDIYYDIWRWNVIKDSKFQPSLVDKKVFKMWVLLGTS